jgi:RNA polymerase sigma-70 factor (ECF subfamily)
MTTIKLDRYYPHLAENITLEVSAKIAVVLFTKGHMRDSYKCRKREHKGCSLDVDLGFEPDVMFPPLTPDEIILDKENRSALYATIDQLPSIQARRVYAHYILGKSKIEIACAENVVESAVCNSIRRGVKNLAKILKNFYG